MEKKKIKKAVLILSLSFLCIGTQNAFAQVGTSLQFNQVILLQFDPPATPYITATYTVPAGKVWKIESAGASCSLEIWELNGTRACCPSLIKNGGWELKLPMWLPELTTINFYENCNTDDGFVSIIEFTVVP